MCVECKNQKWIISSLCRFVIVSVLFLTFWVFQRPFKGKTLLFNKFPFEFSNAWWSNFMASMRAQCSHLANQLIIVRLQLWALKNKKIAQPLAKTWKQCCLLDRKQLMKKATRLRNVGRAKSFDWFFSLSWFVSHRLKYLAIFDTSHRNYFLTNIDM